MLHLLVLDVVFGNDFVPYPILNSLLRYLDSTINQADKLTNSILRPAEALNCVDMVKLHPSKHDRQSMPLIYRRQIISHPMFLTDNLLDVLHYFTRTNHVRVCVWMPIPFDK